MGSEFEGVMLVGAERQAFRDWVASGSCEWLHVIDGKIVPRPEWAVKQVADQKAGRHSPVAETSADCDICSNQAVHDG